MNPAQARQLIKDTFTQPFDRDRFGKFAANLLNHVDGEKKGSMAVPDAFAAHVKSCQRLAGYADPRGELLDVLIVNVTEDYKIERTRTALRDFVAHKLKRGDNYKEAALVAFVPPDAGRWRLSYVRMQYETVRDPKTGVIKPEERPTPARRFSYLVGEGESCHTAQTRFLGLLQDTATDPALAQIEEAFSVEAVTKEFFGKYVELFGDINAALEKLVAKDKTLRDEFSAKGVNTVDFAKKLMGQIVFLYFLQKKGWLGVEKGKDWGTGPRDFLRKVAQTFLSAHPEGNLFNDVFEPLFYDTLATDRGHDAWCNRFKCRIPFLNGGLFEPLADYDWKNTDVILPNKLFTNSDFLEEGVTGTGVLDVFGRYNFTVNEAEPLEKEVAIDPEMLGKVFENLIEENRRKGLGAFYTPREIVHYMCQESLINYLDTAVNGGTVSTPSEPGPGGTAPSSSANGGTRSVASVLVPRADIETFVRLGEQISHYEAVDAEYKIKMPKSIEKSAKALDDALRSITVCDPAVGSGAFPVGMMTEIVRARSALTPYFNNVGERTPYHFKRHAIQNCLYGVDIDSSAVDIAKLRLWLSLVVDEEDVKQVKPLPNLDYKIVVGNSLIELLSSANLHASTDAVRSNLVNRLRSSKDQMFDLTSSEDKKHKREEIERLLQDLFEYDRKKQIEGIGQRLANIRAQGQLFEGSSRKEQSVIHDLESSMEEVRDMRIPKSSEHFEWGICFSEVFHAKQGFDVVIANPQKFFYANYRLAEYQVNLYPLFVEQGTKALRPHGCLCFITPNNWLTINTNKAIRKFVLEKSDIVIVNFYARVFESADVDSAIVAFRNASDKPAIRLYEYTDGMHFIKAAESQFFLGQREHIINIEAFKSGGTSALMQKVESCSIRLGDAADVKVGLGAYGLGRGNPPQTAAMIEQRVFHATSKVSAKHFKYVDGKDVCRYYVGWSGEFLKYGDHLREPRKDWRLFSTTRILVRQIPSKPPYCINAALTDETFLNDRNSMNIINISDKPEYVLGVLNSKLVSWWFVHKFGKMQRGTFPQFKVNELADFPLPKDGAKRGDKIASLASDILAAKESDPAADTAALEREIDQIVYRLYDLTPDEIAHIEGALASTRRGGDGENEVDGVEDGKK